MCCLGNKLDSIEKRFAEKYNKIQVESQENLSFLEELTTQTKNLVMSSVKEWKNYSEKDVQRCCKWLDRSFIGAQSEEGCSVEPRVDWRVVEAKAYLANGVALVVLVGYLMLTEDVGLFSGVFFGAMILPFFLRAKCLWGEEKPAFLKNVEVSSAYQQKLEVLDSLYDSTRSIQEKVRKELDFIRALKENRAACLHSVKGVALITVSSHTFNLAFSSIGSELSSFVKLCTKKKLRVKLYRVGNQSDLQSAFEKTAKYGRVHFWRAMFHGEADGMDLSEEELSYTQPDRDFMKFLFQKHLSNKSVIHLQSCSTASGKALSSFAACVAESTIDAGTQSYVIAPAESSHAKMLVYLSEKNQTKWRLKLSDRKNYEAVPHRVFSAKKGLVQFTEHQAGEEFTLSV